MAYEKMPCRNTAARFPSRWNSKIRTREALEGFATGCFCFAYRFVRAVKSCRHPGMTGHYWHNARQPPAGRELCHHSERGARCRRPGRAGCLGQPSGLAFDCQGKPLRRGPQGRTQTCTRTSHQPPDKRQMTINESYSLMQPYALGMQIIDSFLNR